MIKMTEFAKRRKQFMQTVGARGIIILTAAPQVRRNGDTHYPYRQRSDFYYLTGFEEPEAVAILLPKRQGGEFILFNRVRNRAEEIWDGVRAGQEGALRDFGAEEAYPFHELERRLPELLEGRDEIHYSIGLDAYFDKILLEGLNKVRSKIRSGAQSPYVIIDTSDTLHEMRLRKSPAEIAIMRKAASISAQAHVRAMQLCTPGSNEYELEAAITYEFQRQGGRFHAYTPIIGSGKNTCILHYINNNQTIQKDALVLVDAGCEYQYYASDITRTFPANGRFSAEQKAIYEIVLASQLAALKTIKPGVLWPTAQKTIVKIITQGLVDLGILKGNVDALIEQEAYSPFYMHRSGHWLGLDVHDAGTYKVSGKWRQLEPGMTFTVEPGLYISADTPGVNKRWHNLGVRIEDDVVVTASGCEVLSEAAPKSISAIEALMQRTA